MILFNHHVRHGTDENVRRANGIRRRDKDFDGDVVRVPAVRHCDGALKAEEASVGRSVIENEGVAGRTEVAAYGRGEEGAGVAGNAGGVAVGARGEGVEEARDVVARPVIAEHLSFGKL